MDRSEGCISKLACLPSPVNMIKGFFILLAVTMVTCQYHKSGYEAPEPYQSKGHAYQEEEYAEPHYSFEYSVSDPHSGDYHSQKEERKGDSTHGEYSLVEPDGSRRNVQYHVEGKSGFLAEVHREPSKEGYKPSYQQPSSKPSYEQPSYKPSYQQPSYKPSYEQPSYKPSYEKSSYKPSYEQPAYKKPSYY